MGQHTTDDVYEKVTDVEQKLDSHSKSAVTTAHFNAKVKELKEAIEKGGKKAEEEKKTWQDLVKDMSPVKEFLEVAKGGDWIAKLILSATAAGAAIGVIAGLMVSFKKMTLAYTGRERQFPVFGAVRAEADRERRYLGRREDGSWGYRPEQQADAQQPNLPSVEQVNAVKQAMGLLNTEIGTYRSKVRGLATPRAMKQMASAAKKLESTAKQHQNIDGLSRSLQTLGERFREVSAEAAG